ncbi:helix-turn-helix domain-containing protein [Marinimicrobium alkaliphilum]|uniref:helix-turn-helix domain-containing protein n=1 Tax=Marinimicrobium alkaliphilum TaxID=2202654 RepID=UPI000DB93CFB|nr:AraC family transcriptional regulator [Marinimicrobium alkaliphilum]
MKEHIFNIHDVILLTTVAECILLALFQAVLPTQNRRYSALLAAFLFTIAVGSSATLVLWNEYLNVAVPAVIDNYATPPLLLVALMLKGPILMLSVAAITQQHFRLHRRLLVHLLPAVIAALVILVFGVNGSDLRMMSPETSDTPDYLVTFIWDAAKIVPLVYAFGAVVLVQRYRAQLKDEYSHFSTSEPNWLNILTLGFFANWAWSGVVHIVAKYSSPETADSLGIVDNYLTFILINALFTYSLVYAHKLLVTQPEPLIESEGARPTNEAVDRVRAAMEDEKLYLKHNINIEQFSERLNLPPKEVSSVINKHFGTNFFEFVNTYRVEEAKRLLTSPDYKDKTILDVLMDAGFNSKSAFHRFFKRLVGVSPSEYRKQLDKDGA